jgi:uncharacterized lipoprotein NlpE involved in copper resistance
MISRKIVFVLSIACLLFGLNACTLKGGSSSNQSQVAAGNNAKTTAGWVGTYSGVIPCADCPGIETKLSLKADNTYRITRKYMEKNDEVVQEGTFVLNSAGNMITLGNMDKDKYPTMYRVSDNYLRQLDLEGNVINGDLADKYILKKD